MQIIARKALKEFWAKHNQAETPLTVWYWAVSNADWKAPADINDMFGATVDFVATIVSFSTSEATSTAWLSMSPTSFTGF